MRIFLVCPVRGHDQSEYLHYVEQLEKSGHVVHYPPRDTDQNDDTGLRICEDNRRAIEEADEVHVIWDGQSQGALFDIGMAFMLRKKIVAVSLPERTPTKSFQNMIAEYAAREFGRVKVEAK